MWKSSGEFVKKTQSEFSWNIFLVATERLSLWNAISGMLWNSNAILIEQINTNDITKTVIFHFNFEITMENRPLDYKWIWCHFIRDQCAIPIAITMSAFILNLNSFQSTKSNQSHPPNKTHYKSQWNDVSEMVTISDLL